VHTSLEPSPGKRLSKGRAVSAVEWLRSRRRSISPVGSPDKYHWCIVLRTTATRGIFGAASVVLRSLAIVERVDTFYRVKVRPRGLRRFELRLGHGGLQGTTRRQNSLKVRWSKRTPHRRRSPGSATEQRLQSGFNPRTLGWDSAKAEAATRSVPGVRERRVCVGPQVGSLVIVSAFVSAGLRASCRDGRCR
jgi:hypothetical protein